MDRFTEGSWKWVGHADQPDLGYDVSTEDGRKVCEIETVGGRWVKNGYANARLIAAAPDLLAACKSFIDFKLSNDDSYKLVKAAIAKAEGTS
jgi:hypothetical protein